MGKKKKCLYVSGKALDGKDLYGGVYAFYETFGLPISDIISVLWRHNAIPDWFQTIESMEKAGMKKGRAIGELIAAIQESTIPFDFADVVIDRLRDLMDSKG